jgi:hypothetical protein
MCERAAAGRCCLLRSLNELNPTTGPAKRAKVPAWKGEQSLGETRILWFVASQWSIVDLPHLY